MNFIAFFIATQLSDFATMLIRLNEIPSHLLPPHYYPFTMLPDYSDDGLIATSGVIARPKMIAPNLLSPEFGDTTLMKDDEQYQPCHIGLKTSRYRYKPHLRKCNTGYLSLMTGFSFCCTHAAQEPPKALPSRTVPKFLHKYNE
jgi:hypothetical protein